MDTIVAILRAAHCKSTHHYFAIDALDEVQSNRGKSLANLLLANYGDYLKGAKDPDNVFKDFENHVLHVRDGYWGGAAKTAEKWLQKCNTLLASGNWKESAYAIGVLSHYFTDPFMPLHTAQSPRETIVHRPLEWSVCCSYQSIFKVASNDPQLESFVIGSGSQWMTDGILRGATMANQYYELLIDDYDMKESSRHPELALGSDSKKLLARIFTWVLTGWGSVIDRIANDCSVTLPNSSLVLPTLLAGMQMPTKRIVAAIDSVEQRKEVEKILDEFQRTGNVVRNVSSEQRTVQKVRIERPELRPSPIEVQSAITSDLMSPNAERVIPRPKAIEPIRTFKPAIPAEIEPPAIQPAIDAKQLRERVVRARETKPEAEIDPVEKTAKRATLTTGSPIVDAPAIGPKTAARLEAIGLETIQDLLSHEADWVAAELNTKWITSRLVSQWQDQARLACQIDRLSAAGAGLLVLAGIRTAEDLATRRPSDAHALIHAAAQTTEGKRLLRDQEPPPLKTVQRWMDAAHSFSSL